MTAKRITEILPQRAIVDGTLLVTVLRETEDGTGVIVDTGHGSIVVDKTRLTVLA